MIDCEFCKGQTKSKKVKKHHWLEGRLYVLENVDAEVCMECGERYFYAKTLQKINETLKKEHQVKKHLKVEVVSL